MMLFSTAAIFAKPFTEGTSRLIVHLDKSADPNSLDLRVANLNKELTQIGIQDLNGNLKFSKFVHKKESFALRLNLKGMAEGAYVVFVSNKSHQHSQAISFQNEDVALFENSEDKEPEAPFRFTSKNGGTVIVRISDEDNCSVGVQMANLQKRPASVRLMQIGEQTMFSKHLRKEDAFAQKINLSGMADSDYILSVEMEDATIVQILHLSEGVLTLKKHQVAESPGAAGKALAKGK